MSLFFSFSSQNSDIEKLLSLGIQFSGSLVESFLMRPSQKVMIVYPGNENQSHFFVKAKWGLNPPHAKNLTLLTIDKNKIEKSEKFEPYLKDQRCMLICDSIYSKSEYGNINQKVHPENKNLYIAGFYGISEDDGLVTFCPLIEGYNSTKRKSKTIKNKNPLLLTNDESILKWLNRKSSTEEIIDILYKQPDYDLLEVHMDEKFHSREHSLYNPLRETKYTLMV